MELAVIAGILFGCLLPILIVARLCFYHQQKKKGKEISKQVSLEIQTNPYFGSQRSDFNSVGVDVDVDVKRPQVILLDDAAVDGKTTHMRDDAVTITKRMESCERGSQK